MFTFLSNKKDECDRLQTAYSTIEEENQSVHSSKYKAKWACSQTQVLNDATPD